MSFYQHITVVMLIVKPTLCDFCKEVPTCHHCMHCVEKGGLLLEDNLCICRECICVPYGLTFGSKEEIFCCLDHCDMKDEDVVDSEEFKENVMSALSQRKRSIRVSVKSLKGGIKCSEYSAKDLLVLSQAYIHVTENAVEGVLWKQGMFWDNVAVAFGKLKEQQEVYDSRLKKKQENSKVLLKG
jgi:hypothetical protein